MSKTLTIAKKEYKSYFTGPVAYVVMGLFIFLMSWMFFQILAAFAQRAPMAMMQGKGMSLNDYVFGPHFGNVNVVLLIMVPALTMRLFAEEKKNRTLDLLMTSPLTAWQIVAGKFLAGVFVVWTILATLAVYPLSTLFFAHFDKGPVLTGFLGLGLLSAVYVAIGVFASSLTESVIIAYFVAFVLELFFWVVGWASASMDGTGSQAFFNYLSIVSHFGDFTKGIIDSSGVIYYLTLMFFFCFLTHRVVVSARWR
jgi:ABC-2 type transport system permease protein